MNMLKLDDIADYIDAQNIGCNVQVGKLYGQGGNGENTNIIALYSAQSEAHTALGGLESYSHREVKILVHGGKNYSLSEQTAQNIYALFDNREINKGNIKCIFQPKYSAPVSVGTDDYGIWEFVINVRIIHKEV